jgi:hypothetical protein
MLISCEFPAVHMLLKFILQTGKLINAPTNQRELSYWTFLNVKIPQFVYKPVVHFSR